MPAESAQLKRRKRTMGSSGSGSLGQDGERIKVGIRCRPSNDRERAVHTATCVDTNKAGNEVTVYNRAAARSAPVTSKTYGFDYVFGPESTQQDVYSEIVAPVVEEVMKGFNCTVFAYGQTGTGKTHTMEGIRDVKLGEYRASDQRGVIPRAVHHIFEVLEAIDGDYAVRVSHLEIYNEELVDLLMPIPEPTSSSGGSGQMMGSSSSNNGNNSVMMRILEDSKGVDRVHPLEEVPVLNADDIFAILDRSRQRRQTAETMMNHQSSRSHCIFSVIIHIRESTPEGEVIRTGKLNLVDLAGSENVSRSGAVKERKREAGVINQSLLALGRVITSLTSGGEAHVPYRESKLTRILRDSLGGKTKTCMIATVSPASDSYEETISTLEYAHRAMNIKNRPEVNQQVSKRDILKDYSKEVEELRAALTAQRSKNGVYLAETDYAALLSRLDAQKDALDAQAETLRVREEEAAQQTERIAALSAELLEERSQHASTQAELASSRAKLASTEDALLATRILLEESNALLDEYKRTEEALGLQARALQTSLAQANGHIDTLHGQLDQSHAELREVRAREETLLQATIREMDAMKRSLAEYRRQQKSQLSDLAASFGAATEDRQGQLQALRDLAAQGLAQARQQLLEIRGMASRSAQHSEQQLDGWTQRLSEHQETMCGLLLAQETQYSELSGALEDRGRQHAKWLAEWASAAEAHADAALQATERWAATQDGHLDSLRGHVDAARQAHAVQSRARRDALHHLMETGDRQMRTFSDTMQAQLADVLRSLTDSFAGALQASVNLALRAGEDEAARTLECLDKADLDAGRVGAGSSLYTDACRLRRKELGSSMQELRESTCEELEDRSRRLGEMADVGSRSQRNLAGVLEQHSATVHAELALDKGRVLSEAAALADQALLTDSLWESSGGALNSAAKAVEADVLKTRTKWTEDAEALQAAGASFHNDLQWNLEVTEGSLNRHLKDASATPQQDTPARRSFDGPTTLASTRPHDVVLKERWMRRTESLPAVESSDRTPLAEKSVESLSQPSLSRSSRANSSAKSLVALRGKENSLPSVRSSH